MEEYSVGDWVKSTPFAGNNMTYVEDMYELYLLDKTSVDGSWRLIFDALPKQNNVDVSIAEVRESFKKMALSPKSRQTMPTSTLNEQQFLGLFTLIEAYRHKGHYHANLDPLNLYYRSLVSDNSLDITLHGFNKNDLNKKFNVEQYAFSRGESQLSLQQIIDRLEDIYCHHIGIEYMHLASIEEKNWFQAQLEANHHVYNLDKQEKIKILKSLTCAEGLEKYLGSKFPGAKRFSLEGGDAFIPLIKELLFQAANKDVKDVVIGMAHRGRLNLLVNVLGKQPKELFEEFEGKYQNKTERSGDVKYHMGFSSDFKLNNKSLHLALAFNPSHLEIVSPVVMGSVRARQDELKDKDAIDRVLPITVHGDSAIAGQGVVQETFNMSQTRGFQVGGTIRVVINNQVGFTTSSLEDTRSSTYCTDIAKMVNSPILHVNADDPEAVIYAAKLAVDYRFQFNKDIVIDLVCYRRHGHNEADEPSATQPLMYKIIKKHPTVRRLYAECLIKEKIISQSDEKQFSDHYRDLLDKGLCVVDEKIEVTHCNNKWKSFYHQSWQSDWLSHEDMSVLKDIGLKMIAIPDDLVLQSRVQKIYKDRKEMILGNKPLDWGMAETLAYASLVNRQHNVRITGQDSGRGTFFHRHVVLHDQMNNREHIPLKSISEKQGDFIVYDSVLSEVAALAFEYGYASAHPNNLIIWEAQFGDFANGAQVVIDQFLSSGEEKWARLCGLTLLLPHGYEGQGPEHSSARLERFLQLCADENMQVCSPTTPAQIYHLLRRQVLRNIRKPLVVMSPKSLLRHPLVTSSLEELADGIFSNVLDEIDTLDSQKIKRVVLCSGKVYYDLLQKRREENIDNIVIIRLEQLYPFPQEELQAVLNKYQNVEEMIWCQEEPKNQGAWYNIKHHLDNFVTQNIQLSYVGRNSAASPAVGYVSVHNEQQNRLVNQALDVKG